MLSYPPESWEVGSAIVRQCGKMLVLDRLLVKMKLSGHRRVFWRVGLPLRRSVSRMAAPMPAASDAPSIHTLPLPPRSPPLRRVLLFSTMTKLLDLLEVYLRWRQLPAVRLEQDVQRCHTVWLLPPQLCQPRAWLLLQRRMRATASAHLSASHAP